MEDGYKRGAVRLSKHAEKRLRKRMGISRKATERVVYEAFKNGKRGYQFTGSLRRYLDKVLSTSPAGSDIVIHNEFVFIFSREVLITTWNVPTRYRNTPKG